MASERASSKEKKLDFKKNKHAVEPANDEAVMEALLTKISIHRGSITDLDVNCVVNAANGGLWAGAGVCGAIFRAAGYGPLSAECDAILDEYDGNVPTGQSVITKGYNLYAKHIIHSVGPTSQHSAALASCYRTALDLAIVHNIRSIAFPCISTGIFGFSKSVAAPVALRTVRQWLIDAKQRKYIDYVEELKARQQPQGTNKKQTPKQQNKHATDESDKKENEDAANNEESKQENVVEEQSVHEFLEEDEAEHEEQQETVFDRIDDVVFCCFDIGNWQLYKSQTPKVFISSNPAHSYLWSDKESPKQEQAKEQANVDCEGVIKTLSKEKKLGLITPSNGGDAIFFHFSEIVNSGQAKAEQSNLAVGKRVQFQVVEEVDHERQDRKAVKIRLIDDGNQSLNSNDNDGNDDDNNMSQD